MSAGEGVGSYEDDVRIAAAYGGEMLSDRDLDDMGEPDVELDFEDVIGEDEP